MQIAKLRVLVGKCQGAKFNLGFVVKKNKYQGINMRKTLLILLLSLTGFAFASEASVEIDRATTAIEQVQVSENLEVPSEVISARQVATPQKLTINELASFSGGNGEIRCESCRCDLNTGICECSNCTIGGVKIRTNQQN